MPLLVGSMNDILNFLSFSFLSSTHENVGDCYQFSQNKHLHSPTLERETRFKTDETFLIVSS